MADVIDQIFCHHRDAAACWESASDSIAPCLPNLEPRRGMTYLKMLLRTFCGNHLSHARTLVPSESSEWWQATYKATYYQEPVQQLMLNCTNFVFHVKTGARESLLEVLGVPLLKARCCITKGQHLSLIAFKHVAHLVKLCLSKQMHDMRLCLVPADPS
jgi:hypothetical protein